RIIVAWAFTNTTKGMAGNEQVAGCALRAPVTRGGGCSLVARARATATLVLPRRVMDARGGPRATPGCRTGHAFLARPSVRPSRRPTRTDRTRNGPKREHRCPRGPLR